MLAGCGTCRTCRSDTAWETARLHRCVWKDRATQCMCTNTGCELTLVLPSVLLSFFFPYWLAGYCSQRQTLAQTTAGNRRGKQSPVSWTKRSLCSNTGPSDLRNTHYFPLTKWRNTQSCCHPFLNVQVMHCSRFPAIATKTLCCSHNCPRARLLTRARQPATSTWMVTRQNGSREVLGV